MRSVIGSYVAGIDQAALKEQQQVTARQLQQQQKAQVLTSDSSNVQQSALADAREEVAGYGDEDQAAATPGLGSSLEAPGPGGAKVMPADMPESAVIDQPISQLSAANPAEASPQTGPEPMVETPAPSRLSEAAELSVDERIDVFLEAIRNRSWEQTNRQPVNWADGAKSDLQLPPSGYSEIGGVGSGRVKGQMLNPGRTFYPGQAYEPEVSGRRFALEWYSMLLWPGMLHKDGQQLFFAHHTCTLTVTSLGNVSTNWALIINHQRLLL